MKSPPAPLLRACVIAGAGIVAVAAAAGGTGAPDQIQQPTGCLLAAAHYHHVNPWVLKAILKVESNFNADAVRRNRNGSIDLGMGQINSIHFQHLARWGIAPAHLMDACVSTYVAAWYLASRLRIHGNTWFGVAAYHSTSPCQNARYAGLLWNALSDWNVVPGPRVQVIDAASCGENLSSAASLPEPPGTRPRTHGG